MGRQNMRWSSVGIRLERSSSAIGLNYLITESESPVNMDYLKMESSSRVKKSLNLINSLFLKGEIARILKYRVRQARIALEITW